VQSAAAVGFGFVLAPLIDDDNIVLTFALALILT
jgi:hypothetical protein